jgi:hypothetical protein
MQPNSTVEVTYECDGCDASMQIQDTICWQCGRSYETEPDLSAVSIVDSAANDSLAQRSVDRPPKPFEEPPKCDEGSPREEAPSSEPETTKPVEPEHQHSAAGALDQWVNTAKPNTAKKWITIVQKVSMSNAVRLDRTLSHEAWCVAKVLIDQVFVGPPKGTKHRRHNTLPPGVVWPTNEQIAGDCRLGTTKVKEAIRELSQRGLIRCARMDTTLMKGQGRRRRDIYLNVDGILALHPAGKREDES